MGIPIGTNFDVNTALPLDGRAVVATLTERDAIPLGVRYVGMETKVTEDGKTYELVGGVENGNWQEKTLGDVLNINYIWFANYDAVALASNPLKKIGGIADIKSVGNMITVMAAKSVVGSLIVMDMSASTVTPSVTVGGYTLFNNGDLLVYAGSYLNQDMWKRIPMHEAKTNLDGLMSAWDKQQVNKVPSLETAVAARMPVFRDPDPAEGWQVNWLFNDGWYLGGMKPDCGGHPPAINGNQTSWAVLVLNGMMTEAGSTAKNHRLQIAYDLVNSKIYMRRGWRSSNDWATEWSEVGAQKGLEKHLVSDPDSNNVELSEQVAVFVLSDAPGVNFTLPSDAGENEEYHVTLHYPNDAGVWDSRGLRLGGVAIHTLTANTTLAKLVISVVNGTACAHVTGEFPGNAVSA